MNGEEVRVFDETVINFTVSTQVGIFGNYFKDTLMHWSIFEDCNVIFGGVKQRIQVVRIRNCDYHRRICTILNLLFSFFD